MTAVWLADILRAAGLPVDESLVPDWKSRGHTDGPTLDNPVGVMGHHTAAGGTADLPSLATVRDGRPDLAGPLANLMLSRSGVWVPIAAGRCWHAGAADNPAAWPWVPGGDGNGHLIGIEAESAGTGDWTPAQLAAYPRGVAVLLAHLGAGPDRFLGHLEWAPSRKIDPADWPGDMNGFRQTVANSSPTRPVVQEDTNMTVIQPGGEAVIIKGVGHTQLRVACDFDPQALRIAYDTKGGFAPWPGSGPDYTIWIAAGKVSILTLPPECTMISVAHRGVGQGGKNPRPVTVDTCPAG